VDSRMTGQASLLEAVEKVDLDPFDVATDRDLRRLALQVSLVLESLPKKLQISKLEAALDDRSIARASASMPKDVLDPAAIAGVLEKVVGRAAVDAGKDRAIVKASVEIGVSFDLDNPEVAAWAEDRAGELIVEIDKGTRQAIRALVVRALREGGHPRTVARAIRPLIGLHSRWATAVLNYRFRLEAKGFKASKVEEMTRRYYAKLLRSRSLNIARTEILRAANAGKLIAWRDAFDKGYLGTQVPQKQWIAASDAEPNCAATDGQTVGMNDVFSNALGSFEMPPAHPGCRCTAVLVVGQGAIG